MANTSKASAERFHIKKRSLPKQLLAIYNAEPTTSKICSPAKTPRKRKSMVVSKSSRKLLSIKYKMPSIFSLREDSGTTHVSVSPKNNNPAPLSSRRHVPDLKRKKSKNFTNLMHIPRSVLSLKKLKKTSLKQKIIKTKNPCFKSAEVFSVKQVELIHRNAINSIDVTDSQMYAASSDYQVSISNISNNKVNLSKIFRAHNRKVSVIKHICDQTFATGSYDNSIKVWNQDEFKGKFSYHNSIVWDILPLSIDKILSSSGNRNLIYWDPNTLHPILSTHCEHSIYSLCPVSETTVLAGDEKGNISLWDIRSFKPSFHIKAHSNSVLGICAHSGLFATAEELAIKTWDIRTQNIYDQYLSDTPISSVQEYRDKLLIGGKIIRLWKDKSSLLETDIKCMKVRNDFVYAGDSCGKFKLIKYNQN